MTVGYEAFRDAARHPTSENLLLVNKLKSTTKRAACFHAFAQFSPHKTHLHKLL